MGDGQLVPIIGGSRISGKVGQTNIGLLSMFTDEVENSDLVKNNYSVARVNHDFATSRSSIGGIFVNRSGINLPDDYNRVFATGQDFFYSGQWRLRCLSERVVS